MSVSATGLEFRYRANTPLVIAGASLEVPGRSIIGILGPNGSGKTTLIKLLSGALSPTAGTVTLGGVPLNRMSRRDIARRMAIVPQDTHLAFDYTVLEIVLMGRYPRLGAFEIEGPSDVETALDALESTGTRALASRLFTTLSGGERQRAIIASALAQLDETRGSGGSEGSEGSGGSGSSRGSGGSVLFMDEPTASLDLRYQLELAELVRRLSRERGITVILSTHDLRLASSICSHVLFLSNGRVSWAGTPAEALTRARIAQLYSVDERLVPGSLA